MSCRNETTHASLTNHTRGLASLAPVVLALSLMSASFACKNDPDPKTGAIDPPVATAAPSTSVTTAPSTPVRPAESAPPAKPPAFPGAKAGEMCGGIAVIPCAEGLRCVVSGPMFPDKSGVCTK